jgi:hypothetical protein
MHPFSMRRRALVFVLCNACTAPAGQTQTQTTNTTSTTDNNTTTTGTTGTASAHVLTTFAAGSATMQSAPAGHTVSTAPTVRVLDQGGAPMAGVGVLFSVTAGGGSVETDVVATNQSGEASAVWTLGKRVEPQMLAASLTGRPSFSPIAFAAAVQTDFLIAPQYLSAIGSDEQLAVEHAVARWQAVITNDLADTSIDRQPLSANCGGGVTETIAVDDLVLMVSVKTIDGAQGLLATSSVCATRPDGSPAVSSLVIDTADVAAMKSLGILEPVILHEVGHGLGLGTLWAAHGLVAQPSLPSSPGVDTHYVGTQALAAFAALGGSAYANAKVPLENNAVQQVADTHWREAVLKNELMSARINEIEATYPLSALTTAALEDLGFYVVNTAAADPFQITLP